MSLSFGRVTPEDIQHVLNGLWTRGEKEAVKAGFTSREQLMAYLLSVSGEYGYTMRTDDEPVAVFGATMSEGKYFTWFVATERFSEIGKQATRFLKGFIKERVAGRPDAHLEMISAVEHPEAEKWFNLLGFFKYPEVKQGIFTRYVYDQSRLTKGAQYGNIRKADSGIRHVDHSRSEVSHVPKP